MKQTKHYINNEYIKPDGNTIITKNPSTLENFAEVGIGTNTEVGLAVEAAKNALFGWKDSSVEDRVKLVEKIAEWLEQEYGDEGKETRLKKLIHNEVGKPLSESDIEVIESADFVRYFCAEASKALSPKKNELDTELWPTKESYQIIEPIGVVGIIKPWNYPIEMCIWSVIPALLTGNTVVIKPSEKSSLVGLELAKAAEYAGLPPGVLNIVTGDAITGKALVAHNDIDMISFTGSVEAGKNVAASCASSLKKCTLELGGNDYALVASDANIDLVVNGLIWGSFTNAGQVCVGIKQVLIDESIVDKLISKLINKTKQLVLGRDVSPVVDETQLIAVERSIEDAKSKGAKILIGGIRSEDHKGYYLLPTIITNLSSDMDLVENECFAPVMPIHSVRSLEEAVSITNSSKFGLGASIWTEDKRKADKIAKQLNVGMVWHNDVNIAFPSAPWGGRKYSGIGSELSSGAFDEYGCKKHICFENSSDITRDWWYPYL